MTVFDHCVPYTGKRRNPAEPASAAHLLQAEEDGRHLVHFHRQSDPHGREVGPDDSARIQGRLYLKTVRKGRSGALLAIILKLGVH